MELHHYWQSRRALCALDSMANVPLPPSAFSAQGPSLQRRSTAASTTEACTASHLDGKLSMGAIIKAVMT